MKKHLLLTFCLCLSAAVWAQPSVPAIPTISIKGIAIDSATNKPLGYVTVALQDAQTQQSVKGTLTKDDGSFELKAAQGKQYRVVMAFVGYKNKVVALTGAGADINIGKILLSPSSSQLKEVSVTAVRPLMKQEVDRISYDVQADPESRAFSALDMMRKVPLLSVDANDNIQLKGSGNYKILINGKESALVAKNPSDILKAMPATNIEKIEVITTPPAKYDAEGLAGIINIVTKKNADQGYNIGFNSRFNSVFGAGYNLNGTLKQGKFGLAAFGGLGSQGKNNLTTFGNTANIFSRQTNINQSGTNLQGGRFHYINTELSYEIDTLNLITGSLNLFGNNFTQDNAQLSNTDSAGVTLQHYNLQNNLTASFLGLDAALNYQLGFKKSKDRLLTFSYKYSYSPNKQFNDNLFMDRINYYQTNYPDYQQYNNAGDKEHTLQLDYASPLSKQLNIEAGGKAILRNNYSLFHRDDRDSTTQQYATNAGQTNNFNYHQDIYSLYNSYQLKMDKWTGKAGLRIERTAINADFISAGRTVAPSYNNLIPSVSIQRSFKTSSLNFGYTQRIQRPGIFQLNPFVDRSNPTFITVGNPGLRPELNNTFEFTYSNFTKNSFNVGLSYAFSNNSIQNVSSLHTDSINNKKTTVTYTTFQNLGSNKTLGLNVNTNLTLSKAFTFSINGQLNHVWLAGTFNGREYKNDGYTGNVFANTRYRFPGGFAFGINAGFFSGNVTLQGSSSNFIYSSYVFSKEFFNKKATVSLVANNPYSKFNTFRSTTTSADFYQTSFNQNYYRSLAVRLNFRFGKLNSNIKTNQHGIDNDDKKGSGKSTGTNQ
jgi:outer membrane receptor protein involved in Fe transport